MTVLRVFVASGDPLAGAGVVASVQDQSGVEDAGQGILGDLEPSALFGVDPDVILWDVGQDAGEDSALAAAVAAAAGLVVSDPSLGPGLRPERGREEAPLVEDLTPREREALQLLAEGLSNKEIARRLGTSEHTAKFHVNAILGKLNAHSRTEAVTRAARLGLIIF